MKDFLEVVCLIVMIFFGIIIGCIMITKAITLIPTGESFGKVIIIQKEDAIKNGWAEYNKVTGELELMLDVVTEGK